jgi:internalin A
LHALVGLVAALTASLGCQEDKPVAPAAQPSAKTTPLPPLPAPAAASAAPPPVEAKPKRKKEDCPKGPTITIDNPTLEAQIRLKLQKADGPITAADLHKLRSLNAASVKLDDLDVCVFSALTGLKELFLGPGDYDDLSAIAGATGLETLRASLSKVHDLTPLSKMPKLDRLDLGHTQVNDLTPIAGATALTELVLDEAPVEDLSPLAKFAALQTLSIKNTHVKDVSPLNGLKKLKTLYVMGAPVEDDPSAFATLRGHGTRVITQ